MEGDDQHIFHEALVDPQLEEEHNAVGAMCRTPKI